MRCWTCGLSPMPHSCPANRSAKGYALALLALGVVVVWRVFW